MKKIFKNIFVDCTGFINREKGGANYFIYSLINSLIETKSNEFNMTIFVRKSQEEFFEKFKKNLNIKRINIYSDLYYLFWQNVIFPFVSLKADVTIFPLNIKPLFFFKKSIVVVHDLNYLYFKNNFRTFKKRISILFRIFSLYTSTVKITGSNQEKNSIKKNYGIKCIRIYHAIEKINTKKNALKKFNKIKIDDYYLIVSSLAAHKNIPNCLNAIQKYSQSGGSSSFIFIGNWQKENFPIINNDKIKPFGYVDDEVKNSLYKNAKAILIPSVYEGFGLPFVEALLYKLPLIASRIPVLEELLGNIPYYIEKPFSSKSILNTLMTFEASSSLHFYDTESYLKKFTHKKMGENYFRVIKSILK